MFHGVFLHLEGVYIVIAIYVEAGYTYALDLDINTVYVGLSDDTDQLFFK